MKEFLLYGHGGAYNHGAEAIVKCTVNLIKQKFEDSRIILSTHFKQQDLQFSLPVDEYCERNINYVEMDKKEVIKGKYDSLIYQSTLDKINSKTICLSIGGDNFCYNNWHRLSTIHNYAISKGAKSILWGCSIEPSAINKDMISVLKTHHAITVRESLTYDALLNQGINNVTLCPDPAFILESKKFDLPKNFVPGNTVGINISPLIKRREQKEGIIIKNIITLINYIIEQTNMSVALIPHVVMPVDNDFAILSEIYREFENDNRVCIISDNLSASEYKYAISNCRFFICSRTHASIAAYSTCVPTLAIAYSVKANGIAKDLEFSDYVLNTNEIMNFNYLTENFINLQSEEPALKTKLINKMLSYKENVCKNIEAL